MTDDINDAFPLPPPLPPEMGRPRRFSVAGRRTAMAATTLGLLTGAFAGGFIVSHAATTPTTAATTPSTTTPATGTFHSNENATHESGESAAREAQENAGQVPTVP
jgi:hypothetical protein